MRSAGMLLAAAAAWIGVTSGEAAAQEPSVATGADFGSQGRVVISGGVTIFGSQTRFVATHATQDPPMDPTISTNRIEVSPAADVFVAPDFSLGAVLVLIHQTEEQGGTTDSRDTLGFGGRAGYRITLAPQVSLWPSAGFLYLKNSQESGGTSVSNSRVRLVMHAPVLFHPLASFFLGIGPSFFTDLSSTDSSGNVSQDGPETTSFGVLSVIGGSFGGV